MQADVLPLLAVAAGLEPQVAVSAWAKARTSALKANGGRDDTRTFMLTVEGFHQAHPFDYSALTGRKSNK